MNDRQAECNHILDRISSIPPGEKLVFCERYIHELFGDPLTEKEAAIKRLCEQQAMKAFKAGDMETAEEWATRRNEADVVLGETSIAEWVEAITGDAAISKPDMTVTVSKPK